MSKVVCVKVSQIRPRYKNLEDWMADPQNVYIGRRGIVFIDGQRYPKKDSLWANPFKINNKTQSREDVVNKYREYIVEKLDSGEIPIDELEKLYGKVLGCWCHPEACHGDVLVDLIRQRVK